MKTPISLPGELVALLESLPEPRILVDPYYRILSANAANKHTFGNPEIKGKSKREIKAGNQSGKSKRSASH